MQINICIKNFLLHLLHLRFDRLWKHFQALLHFYVKAVGFLVTPGTFQAQDVLSLLENYWTNCYFESLLPKKAYFLCSFFLELSRIIYPDRKNKKNYQKNKSAIKWSKDSKRKNCWYFLPLYIHWIWRSSDFCDS